MPLRDRVSRGVDWRQRTRQIAEEEGWDPDIAEAQIGAESNFNPSARSPAGATGIAQIMPGTAQAWGVDPNDPEKALRAYARNMRKYVREFGSVEAALRAYNAGPGAIEKSKGYAETNNYVKKILGAAGSRGSVGGGQAPSDPAAAPEAPSVEVSAPAAVPDIKPDVPVGAVAPPPVSGQAALALPQGYQPQESSWQPRTRIGQAVAGNAQPLDIPQDPVAESLVGAERSRGVAPGAGAEAALGWAQSKIGFRETGENSGGLASYLNERFGMRSAPWCAMFTSAAVTKGGAPASARTASVAQVRAKAEKGVGYQRGYVRPEEARPGDLILFGNAHIGMVQRVAGGRIHYVGGNQSDGVTEATAPARGASIVRPKYGARK